MKSLDLSRLFNPLYVLIAGILGGAINTILFSPYFHTDCSAPANRFFCGQEFSVWFMLLLILWIMMAIFFLPGWRMLIWLFNRRVADKPIPGRLGEIAKLGVVAAIVAISSIIVNVILSLFHPDIQKQWNAALPTGIQAFTQIVSACFFVVALPYGLGMFLISFIARETAPAVQNVQGIKKSTSLAMIENLVNYHKMLQFLLTVSGILLSMVPLTSVALRADLITIDPGIEFSVPLAAIIFWGLGFTLLLLFLYIPARFELSIAGQQLRDRLIPLESLNTLRETLDKRKAFDDLLQTSFNFSNVFSSGILTFAPVLSSLFGFLGIKL